MSVRISLAVLLIASLILPLAGYAAEFTGSNAICSSAYDWSGCPFPTVNRQTKKVCGKGKPCSATPPGGAVTAVCANLLDCKGTGFTDQEGQMQSPGDSKGMMDALKGIMEALAGALKGGGGKKKEDQQQQQPLDQQGCQQYYQVSTPTSDPCAYYIPPTSDSLLYDNDSNLTSSLLGVLSGSSSDAAYGPFDYDYGLEDYGLEEEPTVSDSLLSGGLPYTGDAAVDGAGVGTSSAAIPSGQSPGGRSSSGLTGLGGQQVSITSGTRGNIEITRTRGTIVAGARDAETNTEVAGFYGADAPGGQPQGLISRLCQTRPWADSIVTYVIPPSFFDSLCAWRGYQVGTPEPPAPPVVTQQGKVGTSSAPVVETTLSTGEPEVDIWAVPARVPLGARTSVFWSAANVVSCIVTSPDGSFNETELSGGAATVPLTGPTTFTISCLTARDEPVTDFVVVELAI